MIIKATHNSADLAVEEGFHTNSAPFGVPFSEENIMISFARTQTQVSVNRNNVSNNQAADGRVNDNVTDNKASDNDSPTAKRV